MRHRRLGEIRPVGGRVLGALAQRRPEDALLEIVCSGVGGGLVSMLAAMAVARGEGRGALQPLNATSHVLHGDQAGAVRRLDVAHSAVGLGTHYVSALFWAVPYGLWLTHEPRRPVAAVLGGAAATAAVAAAVDYGVMPRRLTPGWELAISRRGVGVTFAGLALGLAGGALLARSLRRGARGRR